jgi:hypothetical protein
MNFELPFSDKTIRDMAGKTMVLSNNERGLSTFSSFMNVAVKSGGDIDRGHFEIVDGILKMMDKQGVFCEFNGIETRNGVVYAVGTAMQTISPSERDRVVMHEKTLLPQDGFGICVSSCTKYSGKTLVPLLESIRKAKFDMKKVVVVVGGYNGEKTEEIEGAKVVYQQGNSLGFSGLLATTGDFRYWLMLPDTCEVERSFIESIGDIDVGLCPDLIRLHRGNESGIGFYRTGFIDRIRTQMTENPETIDHIIRLSAGIIMNSTGPVMEMGVKDVYGTGNRRVVEKLSVGIRKFKSTTGRRIP